MNLKGYNFSRSFLGERVPQHVQNIVINDYCRKNNFKLSLSATEYAFKNSEFILRHLIKSLNKYDGLIFYSIFQLPAKKESREFLYKKLIKLKKIIHFAVEQQSAKKKIDFSKIEKIYLLKETLQKDSETKQGKLRNFVTENHLKSKRNYLERMISGKVKSMKISKKYGKDYWDGKRDYGYGGYRYIKDYHKPLAKKLIKTYKLDNNSKILDIGCGKGFLLYEIKKILKNIKIYGLDISRYAKKNAKKEIKKNIFIGDARKKLKFEDLEFDLAISINTFHNLKLPELSIALTEIERVAKEKFLCVESYRNENEQFNLQCWALTAETLVDTITWRWIFKNFNYSGDFEFIFFN